jgi:hypothetical protein
MEELMMKKKSALEEISEKLGLTKEWEARGEARTAAEREQLRQENERLRQEVEQLRARLGA